MIKLEVISDTCLAPARVVLQSKKDWYRLPGFAMFSPNQNCQTMT